MFYVYHDDDVEEDLPHEDVCMNCGKYFFWSPAVIEANSKLGQGSQRCLRCASNG